MEKTDNVIKRIVDDDNVMVNEILYNDEDLDNDGKKDQVKDDYLEDKIHFHDEQKRINLGSFVPTVVVQGSYHNYDDFVFD